MWPCVKSDLVLNKKSKKQTKKNKTKQKKQKTKNLLQAISKDSF